MPNIYTPRPTQSWDAAQSHEYGNQMSNYHDNLAMMLMAKQYPQHAAALFEIYKKLRRQQMDQLLNSSQMGIASQNNNIAQQQGQGQWNQLPGLQGLVSNRRM